MDKVEKLVESIRNNRRISGTRFSGSRLVNTVGEIYERDGYGAVKLFLHEKLKNNRTRYEAQTLLEVLDYIKKANLPPSIGGYIIRKLQLIISI